MKIFPLLPALLGLALGGCDSFSHATDSVREKMAARDEPRSQVFMAEPRAVYEAARITAEQMEFRFQRGGPAQGLLEAVSGLTASGDSLQSTRQVAMTVRLAPAAGGGTEVRVWLKEIIEADADKTSGQATEAPLRDTALYAVFLRGIGDALAAPRK